ncbi:MAG: hypothetical protein V3569_05405, partial [Acholeplasmataceae bacterium]
MKKVWLIVLFVLSVLTVSGCQAQLDETDQKVDVSIDQFLEGYVSTFVTNDFANDSVLASIYHLDPTDKNEILNDN